MRRSSLLALATLVSVTAAAAPLRGQSKRPLAIEDFYRVLTVNNPQISEDGKTVRFSVATRVEHDNSTKSETFVVSTDGKGTPEKIATQQAAARDEAAEVPAA